MITNFYLVIFYFRNMPQIKQIGFVDLTKLLVFNFTQNFSKLDTKCLPRIMNDWEYSPLDLTNGI